MATDRAWLDAMDRLRYDDPRQALDELHAGLEDLAPVELLPRGLGVAGSCLRMMAALDQAERLIELGLELAEQIGDELAVAEQLQRKAYVVGDRGEHARALSIADQVSGIYVRLGDEPGLGKALVDQGIFLGSLGRRRQAVRNHEKALSVLPADDLRNRFAAYLAIAIEHRGLGALNHALRAVTVALRNPPDSAASTKARWFLAGILVDLGRTSDAERHLQLVIESLRSAHPLDAALATVDLVGIQLLQGLHVEARGTVQTTLALFESLKENRLAQAALSQLFRVGAKDLDVSLIQSVRAELKRSRAKILPSTSYAYATR